MLVRRLVPVILLTLPGCGPSATVDVGAHVDAIRAQDRAWKRAAAARDLDGMMAIYAEDAVELLPGMPPVAGRPAVREFYADLLESFPRFRNEYEATETIVAESGDLAVVRGEFRFSADNLDPSTTQVGKFVGVWRRIEGTWRLKLNISNGNAPPEVGR